MGLQHERWSFPGLMETKRSLNAAVETTKSSMAAISARDLLQDVRKPISRRASATMRRIITDCDLGGSR